jgi:thiol-disulfide isomerase/thioredoxin
MKKSPFFSKSKVSKIALSVGLGLLFSVTASNVWAKTPSMPESFKKDSDGKMVLVDFYSDYCGTCQMMAPKLKILQRKTQDKITFKHIDVGAENNRNYWNEFSLQGTPTYVLYDATGTPVYKMQESIAPVILEKQLLRQTGQLRAVQIPEEIDLPLLTASQPGDLNHLVLLAFENDTCVDCREMSPYLNGFEISGKDNLKVLRLNSGTESAKKLMTQMGIRKLPAYALLDNAVISPTNMANNRRSELFVMTGKVPPRLLWDVIRLFGESGV